MNHPQQNHKHNAKHPLPSITDAVACVAALFSSGPAASAAASDSTAPLTTSTAATAAVSGATPTTATAAAATTPASSGVTGTLQLGSAATAGGGGAHGAVTSSGVFAGAECATPLSAASVRGSYSTVRSSNPLSVAAGVVRTQYTPLSSEGEDEEDEVEARLLAKYGL
jgi:hypothetical protein